MNHSDCVSAFCAMRGVRESRKGLPCKTSRRHPLGSLLRDTPGWDLDPYGVLGAKSVRIAAQTRCSKAFNHPDVGAPVRAA